MKICKIIKYLQKFKFYIDSNSKTLRFANFSTCKNGRNFQFAKLGPREIKVFYSTPPILRMFIVNLVSITFMKVKIILYHGKLYIIAKRNV